MERVKKKKLDSKSAAKHITGCYLSYNCQGTYLLHIHKFFLIQINYSKISRFDRDDNEGNPLVIGKFKMCGEKVEGYLTI